MLVRIVADKIKSEIEIKPMNILSNNIFWDDALVNHTIQMFSNFLIPRIKIVIRASLYHILNIKTFNSRYLDSDVYH